MHIIVTNTFCTYRCIIFMNRNSVYSVLSRGNAYGTIKLYVYVCFTCLRVLQLYDIILLHNTGLVCF
jgi:hypothetical protein